MNRADLQELHNITPIANLPGIAANGILCNRLAQRTRSFSIAMPEIQDRRARKQVPGGLPLHEYANLYFDARNPMMYKRQAQHQEICVLRISPDVLDIADTVIADGNASSDYTRFLPAPSGLEFLDAELVFAESWNDPDEIIKWRKGRVRSAEVLVPQKVSPQHITGVYVSCDQAARAVAVIGVPWPVTINAHLFFR